jgi:hypothetical protein
MGFNTSKQEIISTPEAKGMRLPPSMRGKTVNLSRLPGESFATGISRRESRAGNLEAALDQARRKSVARESIESARSLQLLQQDLLSDERHGEIHPLRLTKNFAGLDEVGTAPSNCSISAGPLHLLVSVNSTIAIVEKNGKQAIRRLLPEIFSALTGPVLITSPKVLYDQFQSRWVIAACGHDLDGQHSRFLLAYSQTSDPLGDWWIWALDAGAEGSFKSNHLVDGLGLSIDNNSLFLTANVFGGHGQFLYAKFRVLNRKELLMGGILHGWEFWDLRNADGTPSFGLQPAVNLRPAGVQYLLNASNDGQGLTLWSYMEPLRQDPVLSRRFIPTVSFYLAPNARQAGTKTLIETGDTRLGPVIFRHGMLWTAHTIAANWGADENVAAIQWFQINPRAGCVIHQGIFGAPQISYFAPAVVVDGESNMTMVFNRSSEQELPSIRFTGRRPSDENNRLQPSQLLQRGSHTESPEWMPFCSASVSPEDATVWATGQYAATEQDWSTWIGTVSFAEIQEARDTLFTPDPVDFTAKILV